MPIFSKRFIYGLSNKIFRRKKDDSPERRLIVDFAKTQKSPFDIKSESSYNAYLSDASLALCLKKSNCIAWVDIPEPEYEDHFIEAKIRLDSLGGYASTGIIFHIMEEDTYYLALVSSKGYFRFDAVKDGSPKALIAWTEISDFNGINFDLKIVTFGEYIIFLVNGKWVGEIKDDSIGFGKLGFALASYNDETGLPNENEYTCKAWLDYLSVDTRSKIIEENYNTWTNESNINAESRLRLAETFAVMGKFSKALDQIKKAWKRRDEAIRSSTISYTEVRTKKELLLASRMAFATEQYSEAEDYLNQIITEWPDSAEGKSAYTEKIKVLNELDKFQELKEFMFNNTDMFSKDIDYYTILARCHHEMNEYKDSAKAWKKAFQINKENGVYAVNAANAIELTGNKEEALSLFLKAGSIFLNQDNKGELEAMMPKLTSLGEKNWEARALAGKWAFSIEDYAKCTEEFSIAENLRCSIKPRPEADPAVFYLWGLVFYLEGKLKTAIDMLKKAVKLAPEYELFRTKLEELQKIRQ